MSQAENRTSPRHDTMSTIASAIALAALLGACQTQAASEQRPTPGLGSLFDAKPETELEATDAVTLCATTTTAPSPGDERDLANGDLEYPRRTPPMATGARLESYAQSPAGPATDDPLRVTAGIGLGTYESSAGLFLRGDGAYTVDGPWAVGGDLWLGFSGDGTQFRLSPYAEYTSQLNATTELRSRAGLDIYNFGGDRVSYTGFGLRAGATVEHDLADQLGPRWSAIGAANLGFLSGDLEVDLPAPFGTVSKSETMVTFDLELGARYELEQGGQVGASLYFQSFDQGDFVGIFGTYTF
ncbi:MAG: hypothetical protein KDC98_13890 [Planctomycetes bacterium]|nr:hypothetical protein [Planctomycetota bacterium]